MLKTILPTQKNTVPKNAQVFHQVFHLTSSSQRPEGLKSLSPPPDFWQYFFIMQDFQVLHEEGGINEHHEKSNEIACYNPKSVQHTCYTRIK